MEDKIENLQQQVLLLSKTLRDVMYIYTDDYSTECQKKEHVRNSICTLEELMQKLWDGYSNENN